jgi:hypothetical protein
MRISTGPTDGVMAWHTSIASAAQARQSIGMKNLSIEKCRPGRQLAGG